MEGLGRDVGILRGGVGIVRRGVGMLGGAWESREGRGRVRRGVKMLGGGVGVLLRDRVAQPSRLPPWEREGGRAPGFISDPGATYYCSQGGGTPLEVGS